MNDPILIVGLGNPGKAYDKTRHNLGFDVVRALASHLNFHFKKVEKLEGEIAAGSVEGRKLYLFLPTTYMNLSGRAVKKAIDYYKIPLAESSAFLVVVDDIYVDFGKIRLRAEGGNGGHNGLKSLDEYLHSKVYPRMRMGVGPKVEGMALEDFVLGAYTPDERLKLEAFVEFGAKVLQIWLREGLEKANQLIGQEMNMRKKDEAKKTTL